MPFNEGDIPLLTALVSLCKDFCLMVKLIDSACQLIDICIDDVGRGIPIGKLLQSANRLRTSTILFHQRVGAVSLHEEASPAYLPKMDLIRTMV